MGKILVWIVTEDYFAHLVGWSSKHIINIFYKIMNLGMRIWVYGCVHSIYNTGKFFVAYFCTQRFRCLLCSDYVVKRKIKSSFWWSFSLNVLHTARIGMHSPLKQHWIRVQCFYCTLTLSRSLWEPSSWPFSLHIWTPELLFTGSYKTVSSWIYISSWSYKTIPSPK